LAAFVPPILPEGRERVVNGEFWKTIGQLSRSPDKLGIKLWEWLREKIELASYKPQATPDLEVSHLRGRQGEYYVIKNTKTKTYYQLGERDYFVWNLLDGSRSVKDLVVEYFMNYGSFAFARIANLVLGLKANKMLTEQPVYIYNQLNLEIRKKTLAYRLSNFSNSFMQRPFAISGLDGFFGFLYRWVGKIFYTIPFLIFYVIVSVAGIGLFVWMINSGKYSLQTSVNGSFVLGMIAFIVILLFAVMIHEISHALTVKHYKREVRRAGFMIYIGMPGFFVDTTDIWMEDKRARLAVTWAGPYSGLILSGIALLVIAIWPEFQLNSVLLRFAFVSYMLVFINLNPFLKLDGYYMLMDWLEISNLRSKSFNFLRNGLPKKFSITGQGEKLGKKISNWLAIMGSFSRDDWIFIVFGLLSLIWTVYAIYLGMSIWQSRFLDSLRSLLNLHGNISRLPVILFTLLISFMFVTMIGFILFQFARNIYRSAHCRGLFNSAWRVAGWLLLAMIILSFVSLNFVDQQMLWLINLGGLLIAMFFAVLIARDLSGSRLAKVFWMATIAALLLLFREIGQYVARSKLLEPGVVANYDLGLLFLVNLCLAGSVVFLFMRYDLKRLARSEQILLVTGTLTTITVAVLLIIFQEGKINLESALQMANLLIPIIAVTMLIPTIYSYWRTEFCPAWIFYGLVIFSVPFLVIFDVTDLITILLLCVSLFLYWITLKRISFSISKPTSQVDLSDERRLTDAFNWVFCAVTGKYGEINGQRQLDVLRDNFNRLAQSAGWSLKLEGENITTSFDRNTSLIGRGEQYADALSLILELMCAEIGLKLTIRLLQTGYDGLPWEEREIGEQYCFRNIELAEELSKEFLANQQDYTNLLRRIPIFATMSDGEIDLLITRLRSHRCRTGRVIIRQGDRGDRFYVIKQGHVEVTQMDEDGVSSIVNQLQRGDYFGELALLSDLPRNATCKATIPTETLSLSKRDFDELVADRFVIRDKLDESFVSAELLRRVPLFAEMDGIQIQYLASKLRERIYEADDVIIHQGDVGESFYLIKEGQVQVFTEHEGEEVLVAERGPGEYVGEVALLLDTPRTASVRALTQVSVLALHKVDFDALVADHLFITRGMERETSRRMIDLRRAVAYKS